LIKIAIYLSPGLHRGLKREHLALQNLKLLPLI
jgi:hypothetical protein